MQGKTLRLSLFPPVTDQEPPAPYLAEGNGWYTSTELARAGWYEDGQHGGVVAALLAGEIEKVPTLTRMEVGRLTVELFRRIPTVRLQVTTQIRREGKKVQLVEASLSDGSLELARAVALRIRVADLDLPESAKPSTKTPKLPDQLPALDLTGWGVGKAGDVVFHRRAIDIREAEGSYRELGPAAIWVRLMKPLIAGEEPTQLQRAMVTSDFGNGVGRVLHSGDWYFLNADLTVNLYRYPMGDWVALRSQSLISPGGRGLASSELFDVSGPIGRATQTLFVDRRSD